MLLSVGAPETPARYDLFYLMNLKKVEWNIKTKVYKPVSIRTNFHVKLPGGSSCKRLKSRIKRRRAEVDMMLIS